MTTYRVEFSIDNSLYKRLGEDILTEGAVLPMDYLPLGKWGPAYSALVRVVRQSDDEWQLEGVSPVVKRWPLVRRVVYLACWWLRS